MKKRLILASQSPRRKEILEDIGLTFTIKTEEVDETAVRKMSPEKTVEQLALLKAKAIQIEEKDLVLAADTVVADQGKIFGKPRSQEEARQMIMALSGKTHYVVTGVALRSKRREVSFVEQTAVTFWELDEPTINWYIHTKEPYDKAGAYGIQGLGSLLVKEIQGDYFNVVGLPIARVFRALKAFNISPF